MRFSYGLPVALAGAVATAALVQPYIALALTATEVGEIAKAITVLIKGHSSSGSGVIIAKQGNTYTVLTAKHMVKTEDRYKVFTFDSKGNPDKKDGYPVNYRTVKKLDGVDLAVLQFTSDKTYRVASFGNSDRAIPGTQIYVAGFPKPGREITFPVLQSIGGEISGRPPSALRDGYALIYTNTTIEGMSGGPVLDENGKLVGIHGRAEAEKERDEKFGLNLGVPINTFLNCAPTIGLNLGSAAPVAQQPCPTPAPRPPAPTAPPALRWAYQTNKTSIDECLGKAYIILQKDSFKNITSNREGVFVSGIAGSYAVDISCSSQYSTIIVAGPDKNTSGLWIDRLWKAMAPDRVKLPPRPANAPASPATPPPALRWSFGDNNMSDAECVSKAERIMKREGLKNITVDRKDQYVSGFADKYAADISCNTEDWMVVVTGADKATAGRWRDKLRDGMKQ